MELSSVLLYILLGLNNAWACWEREKNNSSCMQITTPLIEKWYLTNLQLPANFMLLIKSNNFNWMQYQTLPNGTRLSRWNGDQKHEFRDRPFNLHGKGLGGWKWIILFQILRDWKKKKWLEMEETKIIWDGKIEHALPWTCLSSSPIFNLNGWSLSSKFCLNHRFA